MCKTKPNHLVIIITSSHGDFLDPLSSPILGANLSYKGPQTLHIPIRVQPRAHIDQPTFGAGIVWPHNPHRPAFSLWRSRRFRGWCFEVSIGGQGNVSGKMMWKDLLGCRVKCSDTILGEGIPLGVACAAPLECGT